MRGADTAERTRGELIRLRLPARAENVALARHAIAGLAEALGMDEPALSDLRTVVSEACTNVVLHAYGDGVGPMEVTAEADDESLLVVVRDFGAGIKPRPAIGGPSLRLGMPLIAALSASFEIRGARGEGTEVRMRMDLAGRAEPAQDWEPGAAAGLPAQGATLSVTDRELAAPVITRVISMLAARANLSVDRLSDAILIGDAIAAEAPEEFAAGRLQVGVADRAGEMTVEVGPLRAGAARRVRERLELPVIGGSLEALVDGVAIEPGEAGSELLVLRIAQR